MADSSVLTPITATGDRHISLRMDFYQILGAEIHFLEDGIRRAFEAKVAKPPQCGFSQDTINERLKILQTARDTLLNPSSRDEYNRGFTEDPDSTLTMNVPWDKIPGALCVLQEAGEAETVIQIGNNLLGQLLPKSLKQDVVLAMALAYVEVSRDSMARKPPDFAGSYESLERALKLLQEEGPANLAPHLQAEIVETLDEITPRRALELLSFPLDESHFAKRKDGLLCLRSILWTVGKGDSTLIGGEFNREDFMQEAFDLMTTSEQIELFSATPNTTLAESFEVYGVALALIARAITRKKAHLIKDADLHFRQLQYTKAGREMDFALERGLCSLLMGDLDECAHWLGLDDTSSSFRNQDIVEFITSNSNISRVDDFLPGLCKLLEIWVIEVVFPRFRDTRDMHFKISDYYDDPTVLRYLKKGRASPLAAAAAIVKIGTNASATLGCVKLSVVRALQKVLPVIGGGGDEAPGMKFDRSIEENGLKDFGKHGSGYLRVHDFTCFIKEENRKIIVAGIAVGLLILVGLKCLPPKRNGLFGREGGLAMAAGGVQKVNASQNVEEMLPKMDARYAESLVQKWQNIKSQALGPKHHVEELPEVLGGMMLKLWMDRSVEASGQGWFLEYTLNGLSIESITLSLDGRHAVVEATIKEAAKLIKSANPNYDDLYDTSYSMQYEMDYCGSGWKIVGGAFLKTIDSQHSLNHQLHMERI